MHETEQDPSTPPLETKPPMSQNQETEPGQLLAEAFREQLAQAIQPVVENVRRHMADAVQRQDPSPAGLAQEQASESRDTWTQASSSTADRPTLAFTFTLSRGEAEARLTSVLDDVLDIMFGSPLRDAFQNRLQGMVKESTSDGDSSSDDSSQQDAGARQEQARSEVVDQLFASSLREKTRKDGEAAIRELLHGNAPAARRKAEEAIQLLEIERIGVMQEFWKETAQGKHESGRASRQSSKGDSSARDAATSAGQPDEQGLPQTILRSDQRAQDLWRKARDEAVAKGEEGRRAERAGYEALKRQYEKKSDRWVKKQGNADSAPRSSHQPAEQKAETKSSQRSTSRRKEASGERRASRHGESR